MIGRTPIGASESEKRRRTQWTRSSKPLHVDRRQVGGFSETNLGLCRFETIHNGESSYAFQQHPESIAVQTKNEAQA
jgi:hypothetical protein